MDVRNALKRQIFAAMTMLRQAVADCPEAVWLGGEHPRNTWRIAYHTIGYAHLYLYESLDDWKRWPKHRVEATYLDGDCDVIEPYTQAEALEVIDLIISEIDARIDALDLDSPTCGFTWYPNVTRFELQLLSLRHIHGHLGQIHERMLEAGVDVEWLGQAPVAVPTS
jgi:hypothetical protein